MITSDQMFFLSFKAYTASLWYLYIQSYVYGRNWRRMELLLGQVHPMDVLVLPGANVTVYCGSSFPVYWGFLYKNNSGINVPFPINDKQHLIGDRNITLTNLQLNDSGYYTCEGRIGRELFRRSSFIEVMDETAFGVVPTWAEVKEGSSITLRCGSTKPVEWISVHFINQTKSINNNTITLHNLQKEHSGRYYCRGTETDSDLKKKVFHNYAVIQVDSYVVRLPDRWRPFTFHVDNI